MNLSADKKYIRSYSFIHRYFLIQSIKKDIAQKQMSKEIIFTFIFYLYNTLHKLKLIYFKLFPQNTFALIDEIVKLKVISCQTSNLRGDPKIRSVMGWPTANLG